MVSAAAARLVSVCRQHQFATNTNPVADIEEQLWIKRLVANTDLVMQMRAVYPAGSAHFSDNCSGYNIGAFADCDFGEMRICRGDTIGVTDLNKIGRAHV